MPEPSRKRQKTLSKALVKSARQNATVLRRPCQGCRKRGTQCVYREREQPGLRPGFGKSLEQRLIQMDETLQQVHQLLLDRPETPRRDSGQYAQSVSGGGSASGIPGTLAGAGHPRFGTTATHEPSDQATAKARQPSDQLGAGQPAQDSTSVPPQNTPRGGPLVPDFHSEAAAPGLDQSPELDTPEGLPPRGSLQELAHVYYDLVHPWANILDDQPQFDLDATLNSNCVILHGITVLGFRYWADYPPDPMRQRYVENSRHRIFTAALEDISLPTAQGLAFLALDALGQGPSSRVLNILALLNTSMTQMGLTRDANVPPPQNQVRLIRNQPNESETERLQSTRLFWLVYTLDRIVGVSHGFECRMAPDLFRRTLWAEDAGTWTPKRRIEALASDVHHKTQGAGLPPSWGVLIQTITLLERVNGFLLQPLDLSNLGQCRGWKSQFRALESALGAWAEVEPAVAADQIQALPLSFDPVLVTAVALHHTAVIRMQSVAAFPPSNCSYLTASPLAPGRCRGAIESICKIYEMLGPSEIQRLGPLFVFAVWVAARNMVTLWTSGWDDMETPPELGTLRATLNAFSSIWQCSRSFTQMIDAVMESQEDSGKISNLAVFNDVSKTAYGLHAVLGPRIRNDVFMAELWDWFSMGEANPFAAVDGEHPARSPTRGQSSV